jgi:hypothetical protein
MNIAIRRATPADWPADVRTIDSAFEGPAESALIGALERSGRPVISFAALRTTCRPVTSLSLSDSISRPRRSALRRWPFHRGSSAAASDRS